jgi:hypothetical protein
MAEFATAVMTLCCSSSFWGLPGALQDFIWKRYQTPLSRHEMPAGVQVPPQPTGPKTPLMPRASFTLFSPGGM